MVFVPCDLEIWRMALKNNRTPLPCNFKLCASFHSHRSIQTGVTVRKRPIEVKIGDFLSRVTLKFDVLHWKTIVPIFWPTSSFVHHFVAICELKLDLQSETRNAGQKRWFIIPCNLEISQMTLKDYRAPFLWHINFVHNLIAIYEFELELQSGNG